MKRLLGIVCALAAVGAGADTLGDVRTAVNRLAAREPVRATWSTEQLVKAAGRFSNQNTAREVSAEVSHGAGGISITIPQALLDNETAKNLIGSIRSIDIVDALDFRDALLAMLDNATVVEEKRVDFHARPARLLVMKLNARPKKESGVINIGKVKTEERMNLWVGEDNLPLAADRVQKTTAGFMFLHASFNGRMSYTFAHTPDRLILARVETTDSGSGMGQKVERTAVQTLTLH